MYLRSHQCCTYRNPIFKECPLPIMYEHIHLLITPSDPTSSISEQSLCIKCPNDHNKLSTMCISSSFPVELLQRVALISDDSAQPCILVGNLFKQVPFITNIHQWSPPASLWDNGWSLLFIASSCLTWGCPAGTAFLQRCHSQLNKNPKNSCAEHFNVL